MTKRGFTLIELLVVSRSSGFWRPSCCRELARTREAARRSSCQNNPKQLGLTLKMYVNEARGSFPTIEIFPARTSQLIPRIHLLWST